MRSKYLLTAADMENFDPEKEKASWESACRAIAKMIINGKVECPEDKFPQLVRDEIIKLRRENDVK